MCKKCPIRVAAPVGLPAVLHLALFPVWHVFIGSVLPRSVQLIARRDRAVSDKVVFSRQQIAPVVLTGLPSQRHNSRLTGRMDFNGSADVFCTGVEPREPWWWRRSSAGFDLGLVRAIVAFIVTLCLHPAEWGES